MQIIAGTFKGRKLLSPPGRSVSRPITGLAKKSLFDILGGRLEGAAVVDLYCGTGSLGLEALSRGSASCCFAERDAAVLDRLRRNIEAVGATGRCRIWRGDVTFRLAGWLREVQRPIDIAFVDPPYAQARQWDWRQAEQRIFLPLAERLASDGLVVLRLPAGLPAPEPLGGLAITRQKKYGGMRIAIYHRQ